ncbi:hypothetical protein RhiJN_16841 [Ceratobasidium sp. AG-Ba]|nr:hypothetical protein RhiJN_16841 [Ceratobasidium sp. AG-Ba]
MFRGFELRFVTMLFVLLAQIALTLLSIANIVIGRLSGSFVMLPAFIIVTNASMSIALLIFMVRDWQRRSPFSIQSEVILCATAGGMDLISGVAIFFFNSSDAICGSNPSDSFWNLCSAHFAIVSLLWTSTFLLLAYAVALFCTAWRYSILHPLSRRSVWKQTVKGTHWSRETLSPANPPGSRLRKKYPLDIESLRRVVKDEESQIIPRQMGSFSVSSPMATNPRLGIHPPAIDSPVGFAERMGYFRRDAHGEYIPSTPTRSRETLPANPHRTRSEEIERGTVFTMQTPQPRRPSYPDLPSPFPPRPLVRDAGAQSPPKLPMLASSNRSRSSSESSSRSGKRSDPSFAGVGAGSGTPKEVLRVAIPVTRGLSPGQNTGLPGAGSARTPIDSELGLKNQRLFRVSAPTTPTSALSTLPPRQSFQPSRPVITPVSPHIKQAGARPGYYSIQNQPRSHASLTVTVSSATGLESEHGLGPTIPHHNRPKSQNASSEFTMPQGPFLQVPPATMSPSTRQRISNVAYPLPLPPLSTYPIRSIADQAAQSSKAGVTSAQKSDLDAASAPIPTPIPAPIGDLKVKERPLSTVSSVSCYSTSSASHGPAPAREIFGPAVSAIPVESRMDTRQSVMAPKRRLSRPKTPPTLSRVPSQHGMNSQNPWGGTGNGTARRSLASQFHQPRAGPGRRIG